MRRLVVLFVLALLVSCEPVEKRATVPSPTPSSSVPAAGGDCTADQFSLAVALDGAGGSTIIGVEIRDTGAGCTLRATAELRIIDAGGRLLVADGNPSKASILLQLPDRMGIMWSWQNYCGPAIAIRFVATIGERKATLDSRAGPRCDAPGTSILQFLS